MQASGCPHRGAGGGAWMNTSGALDSEEREEQEEQEVQEEQEEQGVQGVQEALEVLVAHRYTTRRRCQNVHAVRLKPGLVRYCWRTLALKLLFTDTSSSCTSVVHLAMFRAGGSRAVCEHYSYRYRYQADSEEREELEEQEEQEVQEVQEEQGAQGGSGGVGGAGGSRVYHSSSVSRHGRAGFFLKRKCVPLNSAMASLARRPRLEPE
ncbi:unnamed protein product [Closterium sp. NIES-53]